MKLFFVLSLLISAILMFFNTTARAQFNIPVILPSASVNAGPTQEPTSSPISNPTNAPVETPAASPTPMATNSYVFPTIPPIIVPIFAEPTPMALPTSMPAIIIPLNTQSESSPTPMPGIAQSEDTAGFESSTYRSIVAPALSFVTQTNVEEFYQDQSLPEHTANLLYAISTGLMAVGIAMSSEGFIAKSIKKMKEKELVQYFKYKV